HRDVKPSNVLLMRSDAPDAIPLGGDVASQSDAYIPKLADFGLAKLTDQHEHEATRTGAVLGSPSYMAPEQAFGHAKSVGPAADIYALGAILYDALTGRPPFQSPSVLETLEQVRTQEPIAPARLQPSMPRDMQTICLKCLEKDPVRRYESAAALYEDLQRFLRHEPIHARPTSVAVRVARFCRRRPASAMLSAVSLACAVGAAVGISWHIHTLNAETLRANRSEQAALEDFRAGYETLDEVLREIHWYSSPVQGGVELRERAKRQALDFYYRTLESADESRPGMSLAKSRLLMYAGSIHITSSRPQQALIDLERAHDRLAALFDQNPRNAEVKGVLARCLYHMAAAYNQLGEADKAQPLVARSINLLNEVRQSGDDFPRLRQKLARQHRLLAGLFLRKGQPSEALANLTVAIELRTEQAALSPDDEPNRIMLAETCVEAAWLLREPHRLKSASDVLGRAVVALGRLPTLADSPHALRTMVLTHDALMRVALSEGRIDAALRHNEDAVNALTHAISSGQGDYLDGISHGVFHSRAQLLGLAGRFGEEEAYWDDAILHAPDDVKVAYRKERSLQLAEIGRRRAASLLAEERLKDPTLSP
ncbi:MAG: protein kinase, partial [Planctomycetales bacterium]|nr:protein kinase [Planctomycetales bacterium]